MPVEDDEWTIADRRGALMATLETDGWQVALKRLRQHLKDARERLEENPHLDLGEVRGLQAEIGMLKRLIYEPRGFLGPGEET